jgi:prophage regulatory protein
MASDNTGNRFLRLPEVVERTGYSRTSIYRAAAAGKFPAPIKTGARMSAWLEHEVDRWKADRVAATRGAA